MLGWILLAVLVLFLLWLLWRKPSSRNLRQQNKAELDVGQQLVLDLPGNPSTGYTYRDLTAKNDVIETVQPITFIPPEDAVPGAPGHYSVVYRGLKPGRANIKLLYGRSWEPATQKLHTFDVIVK